MALSADDRLLGEKVDNYCSSDEERDEDEDDDGDQKSGKSRETETKFIPEPQINDYPGFSTNTGPKGVINDWREFKRMETEKREEQEKERLALMTKLQMTCRSHLDDEREKEKDQQFLQDFEKELEEFEDEFMKEYRQKRIEEMRQALQNVPKFGKLISLSSDTFLDSIDKENLQVTVIIHVYEDKIPACDAMNGCLNCLAQEYPTVKFCKIRASEARLSSKFSNEGVPALLIYKGRDMIGNFIRLSDEFGEDFFATDIESFLSEHSFLPPPDLASKIIRDSITGENRGHVADDSDSDFDVD